MIKVSKYSMFFAVFSFCFLFWEIMICDTEYVSAAESDAPQYAYGDAEIDTWDSCRSVELRIYWSDVTDADSFNIYLYLPETKSYKNVGNVSEKDNRQLDFFISDYSMKDLEKYITRNRFFFKIGTVINGKESMSKQFFVKVQKHDYRSSHGAKRIAYTDDTVIYDFKIIDIADKGQAVDKITAQKAEQLVKNSEYYQWAMTHFYNQKAFNPECAKLVDKSGNIIPKAQKQYIYDFDNDGRNESFILVSLPLYNNGTSIPYTIILFMNYSGRMQVIDYCYSEGMVVDLIDYGKFRHIHIGSYGGMGAQSSSSIYGVKNGKVKKYKTDRMALSNYNGLMRIDAHMGGGGIFYYDIRYNEYIGVKGKPVTVSSVLAFNKKNVIDEYVTNSIKNGIKCQCYEWFGKYYIFIIDGRADMAYIYEYKNGGLEECSDYSDWGNDSPRAFADSASTKYYVDSIDLDDIHAYGK